MHITKMLILVPWSLIAQEKYSFGGFWTSDSTQTVYKQIGGVRCEFTSDEHWELVVNRDDNRPHELQYEKNVTTSQKEMHTDCIGADSFYQKVTIKIGEFKNDSALGYRFEGRIRDCRGCDDGPISRGKDVKGTAAVPVQGKLKLSVENLGMTNLSLYKGDH